ALPMDTGELDFAAEQRSQLTANGETEAGASVFAGGAGVRLLECLEDESLLLRRDADAGVLDSEGNNLRLLAKHRVIESPALRGKIHAHFDVAARSELDGVGEQILEDLLEALGIAVHRAGQRFVKE